MTDRGLTATFIGLWVTVFCAFLALGAVLPVLPRYVRGPVRAGDLAVAVIVTASSIAALLVRPFAGYLAEARGRRRVMLVGAALMAVGGAGYFMAASVPALLATRLLLGLGEACMFTSGSVWVILIAPPERRGQLIGWYGVSQWFGLTVGPLVGSQLLALAGYPAVWAFAAAAPLAGVAVCAWLVDRPSSPLPGGPRLLPGPAVGPGLALALASAGYATLAAFIVLHLAREGAGNGAVPFAIFAAAYVGTRFALGHLPDRLGPRRVALAAALGEAAGLLLIAVGGSAVTAALGALVMGVGFSLVYPSLALLVINASREGERGAAIGAYTSFWDLGLALSGPAIGSVAATAGYAAAFETAAACAAAAGLLALATGLVRRRAVA
ncbi:MAG TPA: MFS transporter [Candidatus Dormibacteraeota bacterium]|nr:MFS transporter [Candidatus Dormibacteraeota bacterium]